MIKLRSLFAGASALTGLALAGQMLGAASGQAAERSPWADVPVQSLEPCRGSGIALPGSSTCVHFSGSVGAQTTVRTTNGGSARKLAGRDFRNNLTHSRVVGTVNVDTRTPTALGDLRTYASIRTQSSPPDLVRH